MTHSEIHPETSSEQVIVTGAFGYSGKYIARRLLDAGYEVKTLTNSPIVQIHLVIE